MLDQVPVARPRVALVYGDAGTAGHLRAAVAEHVQIVYATAAAEFDAARLEDSRATAALLNLDSCDWLDAVETRLRAAGVAVVYDDPEISRTLQGWEQARWLRHLTAKLSGSTDFDPPRPAPAAGLPQDLGSAAPGVADAPAAQPAEMAAPAASEAPSGALAEAMEQPLSRAEIASMTVNFNAVPEAAEVMQATPAADLPLVSAGRQASVDVVEAAVAEVEPAPMADAPPAAAEGNGSLDVDTEALSALIDARLAEAEGHAPGDAPQVWRVAHGGAVSAVDLTSAAEPDAPGVNHSAPVPLAQPPALPVDDAELMQGLPAIDDWQLVDPDATVAPAATPGEQKAPTEPAVSIDFAGLELVPMEPVVQVQLHTEPIERWMHVENQDAQVADKNKQPAAPDANGGRA